MHAQPTPSLDPWKFALDALVNDELATLVTVVEHSGSVPGVAGTFVVVTEDGQAGTVGGGAAEHAMVERARNHRGDPELVEFVHTESGDGTLCSGVQLFSLMSLTGNDNGPIKRVIATLRDHLTGALILSPDGLQFRTGKADGPAFSRDGESWTFVQPIGLLDTLTIIGGGHVSLALSRVMATLPFRIRVLDNRAGLETMDANPFAHRTAVVDYDRIGEHVPEGDRSWVVVMTFGHGYDREVVERLLDHDVRYLGLMGSAAKIRKLFADMKAAGCDPDAIARVRAPIGVAISSHTPEEIAVSVAAEIIGVRNGAMD
jgi:xanthine dehydrogenase accessory factor